jgi:hypothetical protein
MDNDLAHETPSGGIPVALAEIRGELALQPFSSKLLDVPSHFGRSATSVSTFETTFIGWTRT